MAEQPKKRQKLPNFNIELRGDADKKAHLYAKIKKVKIYLQKMSDGCVTNYDVFEKSLDAFLKTHDCDKKYPMPQAYVQISKDTSENERLFVGAKCSIEKSFEIGQHHGQICDKPLEIKKVFPLGHAVSCVAKCKDNHTYRWSSSPYIEGTGVYLVNQRMLFGYWTSGMLASQYERFAKSANIGMLYLSRRQNNQDTFRYAVQEQFDKSIENARFEELGLSAENSNEQQPIDILTDARHDWRRNTKDTSVVAIGQLSHKVVACEHVTKDDCPISQKHELIGSERIVKSLEKDSIAIGVWAHDCSASINSFVRKQPEPTRNQNETWHGVKNLKKELIKVSQGPKYKEGKTWHRQLCDKVAPVSTHFQYSMRNCGGDAQNLRDRIDTIIPHYQGDHEKCDPNSRCQTDCNYEPGHILVTDSKAADLLKSAIARSIIYRNPLDFALARDTYYVESFNNAILTFMDKRIVFSTEEYLVRSQLAVLHWNENVDREFTSKYTYRNSQRVKKVLKRCSFQYREKLWISYINKI